jgi:hypothetical protein
MKTAGNYGSRLDEQRQEHERHADHDVDDEVIRRRDHGERHRQRHDDGEEAQRPVPCGTEDDDAHRQVPAGVEARHRRVLVDQVRRKDLAVARRALGDGVQQRQPGQPRRGDGEQREDQEPEQPGQQAGVAQRVVVLGAKVEQQDARDDQDGPVAIDVDRVGDRLEHIRAGHDALDRAFPGDAQIALDVRQ